MYFKNTHPPPHGTSFGLSMAGCQYAPGVGILPPLGFGQVGTLGVSGCCLSHLLFLIRAILVLIKTESGEFGLLEHPLKPSRVALAKAPTKAAFTPNPICVAEASSFNIRSMHRNHLRSCSAIWELGTLVRQQCDSSVTAQFGHRGATRVKNLYFSKEGLFIQTIKTTNYFFKIVIKKVPFSLVLMQTHLLSERHVCTCYHGHGLSYVMGMPGGTFAPSCPPGFAHSRLTAWNGSISTDGVYTR